MRNQSGVYQVRNRPKRTLSPTEDCTRVSVITGRPSTIELRACPQLKGCESDYLLYWEFVKKVVSEVCVEGTNRRGRPLGRWEDNVKEYVSERRVRGNGVEWARRECVDRERWRSICHGHPLGRERGVRAIDWLINWLGHDTSRTEVLITKIPVPWPTPREDRDKELQTDTQRKFLPSFNIQSPLLNTLHNQTHSTQDHY